MRRRFGQSLRIGVTAGAVSLLRCPRWGGATPEVLAEQAYVAGADFSALGLALERLLQADGGASAYAGWPVSFVLADELLRLWVVKPPAGVARPADLEAAAALRFQSLYGEAAGGWKIVADWDPALPFFAAALPLPLLAVLEQGAARHQLAVVEIAPHFILAWNRWQGALTAGSWYGLVHDGLLTIGARDGRRLVAQRVLPVPALAPGAEHYWLSQTVAREALLLDLPAPARLQLSGQVPPSWAKTEQAGVLGCQILDAARRSMEINWSPASVLAGCGSPA